MFTSHALFCSVLAATCYPMEGKFPTETVAACEKVIAETEKGLQKMSKNPGSRIPPDIKLEDSKCVPYEKPKGPTT